MTTHTLLLLHAAATLFMAGVIWFVQVVHYPLFRAVGPDCFARYHADHTRLTTRVVVAPMLVELVTALTLLVTPPGDASPAVLWVNAALAVLVWVATFAVAVPLHSRLARRYDDADATRLVATNWLRTALWSARGVLALSLLW